MLGVSLEELLFWKKKQLSKGGDQQSFAVLLDCLGGISTSDLNLKSINPKGNLHLKKNLNFLESVWDKISINDLPKQILKILSFFLNVNSLQDLYSASTDH